MYSIFLWLNNNWQKKICQFTKAKECILIFIFYCSLLKCAPSVTRWRSCSRSSASDETQRTLLSYVRDAFTALVQVLMGMRFSHLKFWTSLSRAQLKMNTCKRTWYPKELHTMLDSGSNSSIECHLLHSFQYINTSRKILKISIPVLSLIILNLFYCNLLVFSVIIYALKFDRFLNHKCFLKFTTTTSLRHFVIILFFSFSEGWPHQAMCHYWRGTLRSCWCRGTQRQYTWHSA